MPTKQDVLDLYQKEYKDEITSQINQNDIEISKILSTKSIKSFKILGKYKKTKIVDNNKNLEEIKKSELYLNRINKKKQLERLLKDSKNFDEKFAIDFVKFKKIYISDLENNIIENQKWLKNKENSYKLSIRNQLQKVIIDRNLQEVNNFKEKIQTLNEQLDNIDNSKIIELMYTTLYNDYQVKYNEKNKFRAEIDKKIRDTKSIDNLYKEDRNIKNFDKNKEKEIKRYYRYFNKAVDTLPEYISNNLKSMPNNKGYIWRGTVFYGMKPTDSDTTILFEKKKGGVLLIHEYNPDEEGNYWYTLKEKKNKKARACTIKKDVFHNNSFSKKKVSLFDFKITSNQKKDKKKKQDKKCDEVDNSVKLDDDDIKFILNNVEEYEEYEDAYEDAYEDDNLDIEEENGNYPLLQSTDLM